jgi:hypothetical protein
VEITYEMTVKFMQDYCKDFGAYAQDPETVQNMHAYYTADVEYVPYTAEALAPMKGREQFLHIMSSHPSVHEIIEPEDIIVDEKRKIAVLLLHAKLLDAKTQELLGEKHYFPLYQLVEDGNNTLKIKKILFWEEVLAPGSVDFGEIFKKNPEMKKGFAIQ